MCDVDGIFGWMNGVFLLGKWMGIIGFWFKRFVLLCDYFCYLVDEVVVLELRVWFLILNCNGKWCCVCVLKYDVLGYLW